MIFLINTFVTDINSGQCRQSCLLSRPCHYLLDSYDKDNGGILLILVVQSCRIFLVISVYFVIVFELPPSAVFSAGDMKMNTRLCQFYLCSRKELLFLDVLKDLSVFRILSYSHLCFRISLWYFNWLSFTPLEPITVLHFEDSTAKVTSQWLPKLYFTVLMPHEMKLCILSLFFLVHVPWFTLAMSFSVSWTENDFESKMGSELAGESSKNVWIHELPFLGQRSPGTAQFWLFCIHRPAYSQPESLLL